jgi:hypothetical protein
MARDLSIDSAAARQAGPARDGIAAQLGRLTEALRRGDLDSARTHHQNLSAHPAASGPTPLRALVERLTAPLAEDDLQAAREALQTPQRTRPADAKPAVAEEVGPGHERARMREAMRNLLDALRTDELDDAQLAYAQLVELSDLDTQSLEGPYGRLLADLGAALAARDPGSAQDLFAALARKLEPGSAVDVKA